MHIRGAFNKFPDFFVQAFKIVVDSWKFSILLLYILWDDWPIFMISGSNEQLRQQLEYTLLKPDCHNWWGFNGAQEEIPSERPALFKLGQWHFQQDNAPVYNSILVTDYLTKMGIKTVPHLPDLASCDFWLFPKLRGCRYETIEEMKEAVMKVIDTLTQEDFHWAFQKFLEWYNKCIAARVDFFEGD